MPSRQPRPNKMLTKAQALERIRGLARGTIEPVGRAALAEHIESAMKASQVPGRTRGEPTGTIKERIVEAGAKVSRTGKHERHRQRGNLKLITEPPYGASLNLMDIFRRTGSTLLNSELQNKLGAEGIKTLVDQVLVKGLPKPKNGIELAEQREYAAKTLMENADAIGPLLWLVHGANAQTVTNAIKTKQRLLQKFSSEEELSKLIVRLTKTTNFPGWLAVEANYKEIAALSQTTLHRLTADEVIERLGDRLQSAAHKLKNQHDKYEAELEAQAREIREARKDPMEYERTITEGSRALQNVGKIATAGIAKMPPGKKAEPITGAFKWRYTIIGNTVKFRHPGEKSNAYSHISRIFGIGNGLSAVIGPEGEKFVINGTIIRPATKNEEPIITQKIISPARERRSRY